MGAEVVTHDEPCLADLPSLWLFRRMHPPDSTQPPGVYNCFIHL